MFGFFSKKFFKEADLIGSIMHKEIRAAMEENESLAQRRLNSAFFAGYFIAFIKKGFEALGANHNKTKDYYKHIADGIYPESLYNNVKEMILFAKDNKELYEEDYTYGLKVGLSDGAVFLNNDTKLNLKLFLLDKKLDFKESD